MRSWAAARAENVTTQFAAGNPVSNTGVVVLEGSPRTGWTALTWQGHPVGGPAVDTAHSDGPAGEPSPVTT